MALRVGVPREITPAERRVAMVPAVAPKLLGLGVELLVEAGAGVGSYSLDDDYAGAGARLVSTAAELYEQADVVLKVQPPDLDEIARLRHGQVGARLHEAAPLPRARRGPARRRRHQLRHGADPAHHARAVHGRAHLAGRRGRLQGRAHGRLRHGPLLPHADHARRHHPAGQGAGARRRRRRSAGHRHGEAPGRHRRGLRRAPGDARAGASRWAPSSSPSGSTREAAGGYARELTRRGEGPQSASSSPSMSPRRCGHHHRGHPGQDVAPAHHRGHGRRDEARLGDHRPRRRGRRQLRAHARRARTIEHDSVTIYGPLNVPGHAARARQRDVRPQPAQLPRPDRQGRGARAGLGRRDRRRERAHARGPCAPRRARAIQGPTLATRRASSRPRSSKER